MRAAALEDIFCAPRALGSSSGPGTQDRLLSDRISPPSLTTFPRGAQLGSCRRQSISSSARRVFWGQSLVWGSKCPLKEIKVVSQIHEDGSLSRRYREMELPLTIWLTLNMLRNLSEPQYLHLYRWGDNHTSRCRED